VADIDSTFHAAWGGPAQTEKTQSLTGAWIESCPTSRQAAARETGSPRAVPAARATDHFGFIPRARIRSRRVLRFIPSSSAARSWLPLVRTSAAAMSGCSMEARAAW